MHIEQENGKIVEVKLTEKTKTEKTKTWKDYLDIQIAFSQHMRKITEKTDQQGYHVQPKTGDRWAIMAYMSIHIKLKDLDMVILDGASGQMHVTLPPITAPEKVRNIPKSIVIDISNNNGSQYSSTPWGTELEEIIKTEAIKQFKEYRFSRTKLELMENNNVDMIADIFSDLNMNNNVAIQNQNTQPKQESVLNQMR